MENSQLISDTIQDIILNTKEYNNRLIKNEINEITLIYVKQLTDRRLLSNCIIKPLMENLNLNNLDTDMVVNEIITVDDLLHDENANNIITHILNGMTILYVKDSSEYLVINIKTVEKRAVAPPELQYTLRGPRDCLVENLDTNISLIRYRLKDKNLKINISKVGSRTMAQVAVLYLDDIVNTDILRQVTSQLEKIDIDGLVESGELQNFMLQKKFSIFPTVGLVERSDMVADGILEGKIVILIEGSGLGLIAPKTFSEFLWSCEDNYNNFYTGALSKIVRIVAILINLIATPLYVAIVSFQTDVAPTEYIVSLSYSRSRVPFTAIIEVVIIEIIMQLIREALLRVPKHIGSAIGIVGTIVIGQAAVSAGVFSPLLLIVASLTLLSSFTSPDFTIMDTMRVLKVFILILTGVFGLIGLALSLCVILSIMTSTETFGIPYLAPLAPFALTDAFKSVFFNKIFSKKRANFLHTKDNTRGNNKNS